MSNKPVGVLGVHQLWSEPPYHHVKREAAETGCRTRKYRRVNNRLVQELAAPITDGPLGVGNALPFSRVANPLLAPNKLHYETPHAGDGTWRDGYRPKPWTPIQVSGRVAQEIRDLTWLTGSTPKSADCAKQA